MSTPIIDLRASVPRHRRLPVDLATIGLWALWAAVVRHLLVGLVLGGGGGPLLLLGVLAMVRVKRHPRPQRPAAPPRLAPGPAPLAGPASRQALAEQFGISEVELFRAQHAPICTVHHDGEGAIQALTCRERPGEEGVEEMVSRQAQTVA